MSTCGLEGNCCEYDGCLRSFMGNLLDECECTCHDWDPQYDED